MRPWLKSLFELGARHGIRAAFCHGVRDADGRDYIPRSTGDGLLCAVEALVLIDPYLLFFQAAVEAFHARLPVLSSNATHCLKWRERLPFL